MVRSGPGPGLGESLDTQPECNVVPGGAPRQQRVHQIRRGRRTAGYTVQYDIDAASDARVALTVRVLEPDVVMFPAGNSSYPWRALILQGQPATRVEVHWE